MCYITGPTTCICLYLWTKQYPWKLFSKVLASSLTTWEEEVVLYIRAWLVFILIIHYTNFHFTFNLDHKHVAASYRTEENVSLNWPPFSVQIYMLYFVWTVVNSCGLDWTAWSLWTISFSIKNFFSDICFWLRILFVHFCF